MCNKEDIKIGDTCAYFYDNQNMSFSIVTVVKELSEDCVVVKFNQVLRDGSGNNLFTYLCKTGKTMNVSKNYLHKINIIDILKKQLNRANSCIYDIEYAADKAGSNDRIDEALEDYNTYCKELLNEQSK